MSVRRTIALSVGGVALVGIGVGAGFMLHSPDERITADLPDTPLTTTIESQALSAAITGSGSFQSGGGIALSVQAPANRSLVVSGHTIKEGNEAAWCKPIIEVSGRPVFALKGAVPAYRDLADGDSGEDVRQLQTALRDCGYNIRADGYYGDQTAAAIKEMYKNAGYVAPTSPEEALIPVATAATDAAQASFTGAVFSTVNAEYVLARTTEFATDGAGPQGTESPTSQAPASTDSNSSAGAEGTAPGNEAAIPEPPKVLTYATRGELKFLRTLPTVSSLLPVGAESAGEPVAQLTFAGDTFMVNLPAEHITQVKKGQNIILSFQDWTLNTTLPELPGVPTYNQDGAPTLDISIPLPDGAPTGALGQLGEFTINLGSDTPYDLVVPVSALFEDTSGQQYVWKAVEDPEKPNAHPTQRVDVTVIESAGGYSAIEASSGELSAGDRVVIGSTGTEGN